MSGRRSTGGHTAPAATVAGESRSGRATRTLAALLLPTVALQAATTTAADAGPDDVCAGEHLYPSGSTASLTYTAPAGHLVSSWCVKAGPTPEYHHADDGHGHTLPAASVTIAHSTGKDVSHYSVVLVPAPPTEQPLTLAVDALGDLDRAYGWAVDKDVDRTRVDVAAGQGDATFRYSVQVRALGATSSGWRLGGSLTVRNPNTHAALTLAGATVSTDLGGGATCSATLPTPAVVPAASGGSAGTLAVPFACSFTTEPSTTGTVHAAVTWDPAGPVSGRSATGGDPVTLALDDEVDEVDEVVDVVDDKTVPGRRVVLEQGLVWSEGLVRTYTYDLVVPGPAAGTCADHTNTAVGDTPGVQDPSDSVTVRVCSPATPQTPLTPPVAPVVPPEVLPGEAFGKAVGSVTATCQGTVRSLMRNRTGERVVYNLRVGSRTHRVAVRAGTRRKLVTHGPARAEVVLKIGSRVLDRARVPHRCAPPEVLPDTGLRVTTG